MLFRIKPKCGGHEEAGVFYKEGDLVDSPHDLAKLFGANKFERVQGIDAVSAPSRLPDPPAEVVPAPASKKRPGPKAKEQDVTGEFPEAKEHDVQVILRAGRYFVMDADKPTVQLSEFQSKAACEAWLKGL